MNYTVPLQLNTDVKKTIFKLKPLRRDGLLLSIHHSKKNCKIRFVYCCFHHTGHIIASADNSGHLYIIDFLSCKFWGLPKLDSCSFIRFSSYNQDEILSGRSNGDIHLINSESGKVTGKLIGHKFPVKDVSFAQNIHCLSASDYEAIIWDLETNTKVQVLTLESGCSLKTLTYMPVSNNILACFQDDLVQIWNNGTFETVKQFLPMNWNNFTVKSVAFSRNGQIMVIAGYLPLIAVFLLDKWKLSKLISLPDYIHTIKNIEFVPQHFDGGCNKILAILSGQGIIGFYDIEQNIILSELIQDYEITRFECGPHGTYIACTMCSGEVELYHLDQYLSPPVDLKVEKIKKCGRRIKFRSCVDKIELIKDEIDSILDSDKLKAILKEYGEYPEIHRNKIWEQLLQLPNNIQQYNSIINHVTVIAFKDLYAKYPLESTITIKGLKNLLNNVVTWCPFFVHVDYLPVFAFPFVKVFQNKPVTCFEAVCTIILNWCQHWFEYFPLPPMNILAIIENILMEHDPELLCYLSSYSITTNLYAWTLLETAFSEVLTTSEWLAFWDHLLTNEPSFLLCAVVSYNTTHRNILMCLKTTEEFELFYHNQNPNDLKKFLSKTYYILNNTNERIHPRQYLETFKSIEMGNYPLFMEYPKTILDLHSEHVKNLNTELLDLNKYEAQLIEEAKRKWKEFTAAEIEEEEVYRQKEISKAAAQKLKKEEEKVKLRQAELHSFRKVLEKEQQSLFDSVKRPYTKTRDRSPIKTDREKPHPQMESEEKQSEFQEKLMKRYIELLKCKYRVKEILDKNKPLPVNSENEMLEKYQEKLDEETTKIKNLASTESLKKLNIATSMVVLDKLIANIEGELQEKPELNLPNDVHANMRVKKLQMETKTLEKAVAKLLKLISTNDKNNMTSFKEKESCSCGPSCPKSVRFSKSANKFSD